MTLRPCSKRSRRRYLLPVLERVRGWGRGGLANVASLSYTPATEYGALAVRVLWLSVCSTVRCIIRASALFFSVLSEVVEARAGSHSSFVRKYIFRSHPPPHAPQTLSPLGTLNLFAWSDS